MPKDPDYGVRQCCIPGCKHLIPRTRELPVCHLCGVKIAVAHKFDADRIAAVDREVERQRAERKSRHESAYAEQSQVYYIRIGDHIKIGYSANMRARLSQLRVDLSALLATEPGGRDLEKERHYQFRSERFGRRREDFNPSERLLAHIDSVRAEHGQPKVTGYRYVS